MPFKSMPCGKLLFYQSKQYITTAFYSFVGTAVRIGRKVVEIAIILATKFPAITFALILTSFINLLISAVPLIGPALAPIVGPLVTATGLTIVGYKDISDPELKENMEKLADDIKDLFSAALQPNPA